MTLMAKTCRVIFIGTQGSSEAVESFIEALEPKAEFHSEELFKDFGRRN